MHTITNQALSTTRGKPLTLPGNLVYREKVYCYGHELQKYHCRSWAAGQAPKKVLGPGSGEKFIKFLFSHPQGEHRICRYE